MRRENQGEYKLGIGAVCCRCHKPFRKGGEYELWQWRTPAMPVDAFYYSHVLCAEMWAGNEAKKRWGERAYVKYQDNDLPTSRYKVGLLNGIFHVRGIGDSWEAAFANADRKGD